METYLRLLVSAVTIYLPFMLDGSVGASAISYGVPVSIDTGNWIEASCVGGQVPTVRVEDGVVVVLCEGR